jgi:oligosaccharide repeat unit polymerase
VAVENWILSVTPSLLLLLLAWIAHRQLGGWLAPSAVFGLYWAAALILPLVLTPQFEFWPGASWLIWILGLALHSGVMAGRFMDRLHCREDGLVYRLHWGRQVLVVSMLLGILSGFILILEAGFPLIALLSPRMISEIGRHYAAMRYAHGEAVPVIVRFLSIFMYLGCLLGGVSAASGRTRRSRLAGFLPFLAGFINAWLVNARTGLIWMTVFFVSSYLAMTVLQYRHKEFPMFKQLVSGAVIVGLFIALFVGLQMVREGERLGDMSVSLAKARVSGLSEPFVFSHWLKDALGGIQPSWGSRSFSGAFWMLGVTFTPSDWEGVSVLTVGEREFTPNVYTVFRQLVEDYTLLGSIVAFIWIGLVAGIAYRKVLNGIVGWLPILAAFYAMVLGSYLASWLSYTTLFLGWSLFWFLLSVAPRLLRPVFVRPQSDNSE